jgi:hypothetical protein
LRKLGWCTEILWRSRVIIRVMMIDILCMYRYLVIGWFYGK